MAVYSSSDSNKYTVAPDATLDLPNGDWCIAIWYMVSDLGGTIQRWLLNVNTTATPNIRLGINCNAYATQPSKVFCLLTDSAGTTKSLLPGAEDQIGGGDTTWRLLVVQRNGANLELYNVNLGATASGTIASVSVGTFGSASLGSYTWHIGSGSDGSRDFVGAFAEGSFVSGEALSLAEVNAMASGKDIDDAAVGVTGANIKMYLKFLDATGATVTDESGNGNSATKVGSPTTLSHPYTATTTLYGRPKATVTGGNWTASDAGSDYYNCIDEVTADDSDYIESPVNPSNESITIPITDMSAPGDNDMVLVVRSRKS